MTTKKRRIKRGMIQHISLVPRGANRLPAIYKSEGCGDILTLTKALDNFEELGELTAVVYAPEFRDSQGDIAAADVVKQLAYDFQRYGEGVDFMHNGKTIDVDKAFVAESYIVQKGDARFQNMTDDQGQPVDVTGGWGVVIKIEDKELRKLYSEGAWQGVSMGGTAEVEAEKSLDQDTVEQIVAGVSKNLKPSEEELDMKPEELKKALEDNNASLVKSLTEGLSEVLKSTTTKDTDTDKKGDDDKPVFKGDASDVKALRSFQKELEVFNLKKSTDFTDPKAVEAFAQKIEELNKADVVERKESNAITSGNVLKVTDDEIVTTAKSMASVVNQERGTVDKKSAVLELLATALK